MRTRDVNKKDSAPAENLHTDFEEQREGRERGEGGFSHRMEKPTTGKIDGFSLIPVEGSRIGKCSGKL